MLSKTSRVDKDDRGILFYQQDILYSSYIFSGDVTIDTYIDYLKPGFGIVLLEKNANESKDTDNLYLFKLGDNDFRVIRKYIYTQKEVHTESTVLSASKEQNNIHLTFTLKNNVMSCDYFLPSDGRKVNVGVFKIPRMYDEFYIGIYSNSGNRITDIAYLSGAPDKWNINIENTHGGRLSFLKNGFKMENCLNNAELEQDDISLSPGTYYLDFKTSELNNLFDIKAYVFPSKIESISDNNFEDEKKNILTANNSFTLNKECSVSLKFVGKNGIVKDICIKDNKYSSFVESDPDTPVHLDGSFISIKLKDITKIKWTGTVKKIPTEQETTPGALYSIAEKASMTINQEAANVALNKPYVYIYTVDDNTLKIYNEDGNIISKNVLPDGVDSPLIIYRNVTAFITDLIVYDKTGHPNNAIAQNIFRRYVKAPVSGPIFVYSKGDRQNPYDISASYREIATIDRKLEVFSKNQQIILKDNVIRNPSTIKVYGIPKGSVIKIAAKKITDLAESYIELTPTLWSRKGSHINIPESKREEYSYIAIEYDCSDDYTYYFTNYERELYDKQESITLEKTPIDDSSAFIVYGMLPEANYDESKLYRVSSVSMIDSIDLCCDAYEELLPSSYEVDILNSEIRIKTDIRNKYSKFIVDYLKGCSYAINYVDNIGEFAVDIATNDSTVTLEYDTSEKNDEKRYKVTTIEPDKEKYIVIKKAGETK